MSIKTQETKNWVKRSKEKEKRERKEKYEYKIEPNLSL
jgi:hypothetical protein